MKIFLEYVGTHGLQIVLQYLFQLHRLILRQIPDPLQQTPAAMFQQWFMSVLLETFYFSRSDLVDGLIQQGHDVEAIQYVNRMGAFCLITCKKPFHMSLQT